jgi:predicted HNH restriction endonuclease
MAINLKDHVENSIKNILCFDVKVDANENSSEIYIYNEDETILRKESWEITVAVLDNQLIFEFAFNNSAKRMQDLYLENFTRAYQQIITLISNIKNDGWSIRILSNGSELLEIPTNLNGAITINAKKISDQSSSLDMEKIANHVLLFTSIVLFPLVPDNYPANQPAEEQGMPEGTLTKILVNKYERNPKNRAICISYYGSICVGCKFSFGDFYGEFAKDYIHVHHLTPVSALGNDYVINPIKDLVPLCPNCHNAVHIENPPLSIAELQKRIGDR